MNTEQKDLFTTKSPIHGSHPVIIELRGLGPIPSFKNRKLIRTWLEKVGKVMEFMAGKWWVRKDTIKIRSMLYLEPDLQKWMETATLRIESQLRSALATSGVEIRTAASPQLLIATLLPLDDCWTAFREVSVKSELCAPGQEGATITIERIK